VLDAFQILSLVLLGSLTRNCTTGPNFPLAPGSTFKNSNTLPSPSNSLALTNFEFSAMNSSIFLEASSSSQYLKLHTMHQEPRNFHVSISPSLILNPLESILFALQLVDS
jgi:hypothetical protein